MNLRIWLALPGDEIVWQLFGDPRHQLDCRAERSLDRPLGAAIAEVFDGFDILHEPWKCRKIPPRPEDFLARLVDRDGATDQPLFVAAAFPAPGMIRSITDVDAVIMHIGGAAREQEACRDPGNRQTGTDQGLAVVLRFKRLIRHGNSSVGTGGQAGQRALSSYGCGQFSMASTNRLIAASASRVGTKT